MAYKPNEFVSILKSKFRFVDAKNRGDDHCWFELKLQGHPVIFTKVSHNNKELGATLLGKIARQLRVKRPFLDEMIGCTKSCEEYYAQVMSDPYPLWYLRR